MGQESLHKIFMNENPSALIDRSEDGKHVTWKGQLESGCTGTMQNVIYLQGDMQKDKYAEKCRKLAPVIRLESGVLFPESSKNLIQQSDISLYQNCHLQAISRMSANSQTRIHSQVQDQRRSPCPQAKQKHRIFISFEMLIFCISHSCGYLLVLIKQIKFCTVNSHPVSNCVTPLPSSAYGKLSFGQ